MKSFLILFFWVVNSSLVLCQQVNFVQELPFPEGLISSESMLRYHEENPKKLMASILAVDPKAKDLEYYTVVLGSNDLGSSWSLENRIFSKEAADPWIHAPNKNQFILSDISEGNAFHLKTWEEKNGSWSSPTSHGFGHDHATIISDKEGHYLFSTQKLDNKMVLYVAKGNSSDMLLKSKTIELFNGCDLSVKKPVFFQEKIAIPVVLRGEWDGKSSKPFGQMSSWLIMMDKETLETTAPLFMTNKSGAKHHILVNGNDELYYFYTDVDRKKMEVIKLPASTSKWTAPTTLAESPHLINLDAVQWHGNKGVVLYTVEESPGNFQKYLLAIDPNLSWTAPVKLGPLSIPDERNGWAGRAWPQGGDYCGLISHLDGALYAVWSAAPKGIFKPYFSKITLP
ncbi:hypothetical protein [Flagellimonas myxillae]|uniref:hypothetical protein n=1 Tax=Flagellimonas myxillae TaxID=2942214 RepID=UPI00201F0000|nr:hypothetical protein [Muricauda myxillae]MCL6265987.1 hypothetical protein [Muricauda myxillae]